MKRRLPYRTLLGIALALFGVLLLMDRLKIFPGVSSGIVSVFANLWPFAFLALGMYELRRAHIGIGVLSAVIGLIFLAAALFGVSAFSLIWPFALIAFGLRMFSTSKLYGDPCDDERIDETALFTHARRKELSPAFKGGNIYCMFGGVTLDLRDVMLCPEGGDLAVSCTIGSVRIGVPAAMKVVSRGRGIFGEWTVKGMNKEEKDNPALTIHGTSILGNVEIVMLAE